MPNEYVQALEGVRELDAFAAVVYSSNFEFEAMGSGEGDGLDAKTGEGLVQGGGAEMVGGKGEGVGVGIKGLAGGLFENVWGRVRGGGGEPITG